MKTSDKVYLAFAMLMIGFAIGATVEFWQSQREAVRNGAAEYYIDPETLSKEFRWRGIK